MSLEKIPPGRRPRRRRSRLPDAGGETQVDLARAGKVAAGLLTYGGRLIEVSGSGTPSLPDIALALSRMPRFGGHCRRWWTVLDHSLFCEHLARDMVRESGMNRAEGMALRLFALLHDAAEAVTGDIPTHWKTDDLRDRQRVLDTRIAYAFLPMGAPILGALASEMKAIDHAALLAEAYAVGPPHLCTLAGVETYFGRGPHPRDEALLRQLLLDGLVGVDPAELAKGPEHPQVRRFLELYLELR